MLYQGTLSKMKVRASDPVQYILSLGEQEIRVNELIGHRISINFGGDIFCRICGKKLKKAYGEGFCYVHFMKSPENSPCILRPELCEGHLGIGRDPEWEEKNHNQPHVVYLALTSGVKVGVTRKDQVPTRWIDQGAWKAIVLAETPYRQLAGLIEVSLKAHISDKTPWQKMLKGEQNAEADLHQYKRDMASLLDTSYREYLSANEEITELQYPVLKYPSKVKSLSLDKVPEITGQLQGIRGQYLLFEGGQVLNIRRHTGYNISLGIGV